MPNFPQYVSELLTELTSQPAQGLDAFDVSSWCPIIKVDPAAHQGKLIVDRNVLTSTEADRDLSRAPLGRHKPIQLGDPTTVSYETYERASPAMEYDIKEMMRAQPKGQGPVTYRARIARLVTQTVHQKCYNDVASLFTTAANWTNNSTLAGLTNGSGVQLSDYTDGDIIRDVGAAIEAYQAANGQMDPAHLVINRKALQHATRQTKTKNNLPDNAYGHEGDMAVAKHIEAVFGLKVHVQTAAKNNSLMWGAAMMLLPNHQANAVMLDNGARIDPVAGALIEEDLGELAPAGHFIREFERDDGLTRTIAAVKSYDVVVCDAAAAYLVTSLY